MRLIKIVGGLGILALMVALTSAVNPLDDPGNHSIKGPKEGTIVQEEQVDYA